MKFLAFDFTLDGNKVDNKYTNKEDDFVGAMSVNAVLNQENN